MSGSSWAAAWYALCVTAIAPAMAADDGGAQEAYIDIEKATWQSRRGRLSLQLKGRFASPSNGTRTVTLSSGAGKPAGVISVDKEEDDGRFEVESRIAIAGTPCNIVATIPGAQDARKIRRAPANCSDGDGVPVNQAPIANAGPDQTVQLTAGQATVQVALDGSGSSDPDDSISAYSWTGPGDPADVVTPTVTLGEGSHVFSLTVTDSENSATDTVRVVVQAADVVSNQAPIANAGPDQTIQLSGGQATIPVTLDGSGSSDPDGTVAMHTWTGTPNPADTATPVVTLGAGTYVFSLSVMDNDGSPSAPNVVVVEVLPADIIAGDGEVGNVSINSTSQNADFAVSPVAEQPFVNLPDYAIVAANDLGMHCADLDYQVFSILPPFNVKHAQVIRKGNRGDSQILGPNEVEVVYSAASSADDPALANPTAAEQGKEIFKSNFWDVNPGTGNTWGVDTYDSLYPTGILSLFPSNPDVGLPVPDLAELFLGDDGTPNTGDEMLTADQQKMSGITAPYVANEPQHFDRFDKDLPFFINFPFGYTVKDANWFAADGYPIFPIDDDGRENAYPLSRVQARAVAGNSLGLAAGTVLASIDIVTPVASEADCQICHALAGEGGSDGQAADFASVSTYQGGAALVFASENDDAVPGPEKLLNAAKQNVLRLHDAKHGAQYTSSETGNPTPCDNGTEASCLDNRRPVQCAWCHYTPALDLAMAGPVDETDHGPNGRQQTRHITMSRAMHGHHGEFAELFPDMPSPAGRNPLLAEEILEKTCYSCHPGKRTQCLRGAMAGGGVVCQDCHGDMRHVGNDFSEDLATTPFPAGANLNKRVPWGSEPGCKTCHSGDAVDNLADSGLAPVAPDGIRLLKAFTVVEGQDAAGDGDGTEVVLPIEPTNRRFAENENLYRLSKGHGGVMCEGCHGSTHAIYPNPFDAANDNIASKQLQGHAGTVSECSTCHTGTLGLTLDGPHGMHPVGESRWNDEHKELQKKRGPDTCKACHGQDGRGTVLSRTAQERTFDCKEDGTLCGKDQKRITVSAGTPIGCVECHDNYINGHD